MFLTWGGVRTLSQFTLTALTCSMVALLTVTRSHLGVTSGVWLGLALMKPQVALPVFLWSVFTRRWRVVLVALAVVAALYGVFCARAGSNPLQLVARHVSVLKMFYTGNAILSGASELRPLIAQLAGETSQADAIAGSIALVLLAAICVMGISENRAKRPALYAAPPLVACWALMTFYHLTYGFVVLLPVMMMLAFDQSEPTSLRRRLFWLLQLGMMFDIPGFSRRAGFGDTTLYAHVLSHADRVLFVALFAGLMTLAITTRESWQRGTIDPPAAR
jgi:hypothetical protein